MKHKTKKRRPKNMENNWLTTDELLRLLKAARERSVRDWALLLTGYRHALRAQEVSNLTLNDVDLKTRTIRVRRVKGSLETIQPLEKRAGQPLLDEPKALRLWLMERDRKSTRLNSSHGYISYAVFCLKKKTIRPHRSTSYPTPPHAA